MKKLLGISAFFCLVMLVIACGGEGSKSNSNLVEEVPIGSSDLSSGEINCPALGYGFSTPEEAALSQACDYARSWNLSFEFLSAQVVSQDSQNKTAQVHIVFNEFGCGNCPQENEVTVDVFVNVDKFWQNSGMGLDYHLTGSAQATVAAAKQSQANQLASTIKIVRFGSNEGSWVSLSGNWAACTQGSGVCPVTYGSGNRVEVPILLAEPKDNLCNDSVFLEIKALLPDGSEEVMEDRVAGSCEIRGTDFTDGTMLFNFYPIRDLTFCVGPPYNRPECDRNQNTYPVKILAYRAVLRSSLSFTGQVRDEDAGDWISAP